MDYRADDTLTFEVPGEEPKTVPVKRPATADVEAVPTTIALPKVAPAPAVDEGLDFDLESLSPPAPRPATGETSILDFGDFGLAEPATIAISGGGEGALARKLELAEEFRQIGDLEGARDLLEEVIAKADGTLQSKAQGMLDKLG